MNWEAEAADMTGLSRDFLNNKRERERELVMMMRVVISYLVLAH